MIALLALALAQDAFPIRVDTRLVPVSVLVRDKNGPVRGLTKDDFTLLDRNRKRTIASFAVESVNDNKRTVTAAKLPRDVFSNAFLDAPSNATIILFDALNIATSDQMWAREQMTKLLRGLKPTDRVGLMLLGQRLRIVQGFASDASNLLASLDRFRPQANTEDPTENILEGPSAFFPEWMQALLASPMSAQSSQRVALTVRALQEIARHLHSVPGRKNLIWISGGFPIQIGIDRQSSPIGTVPPQTFAGEIIAATRALNDAGVAVYPIDARGLESGARRTLMGAQANPELTELATQTLLGIAADTGGVAAINTNDLTGAMRRALDDGESSYTLGFYVSPQDLANKFHSLNVQVKRKDVVVRSRRGYLASKDKPTRDDDRLKELGRLLASPLESTAIKIGAKTAFVEVEGKRRILARVFIDAPRIAMEDRDGKKTGAVDIVLDLQGADGRSLSQASKTLHLNLTEANYRKMLDQSLQTEMELPDHPQGVRLCLAVLDRFNGATGSASRSWPLPPEK